MTTPWIVAFTLVALVVLATLALVLGLLKRALPALERAELLLAADPLSPDSGLRVGSTVPDFAVEDASGQQLTLAQLTDRRSVTFLFLADECPSCVDLLAEVRAGRWDTTDELVVVIDEGDLPPLVEPGFAVVRQVQRAASEAFRQTAYPQAFVVDGDRVVVGRTFPHSLQGVAHVAHTATTRPTIPVWSESSS